MRTMCFKRHLIFRVSTVALMTFLPWSSSGAPKTNPSNVPGTQPATRNTTPHTTNEITAHFERMTAMGRLAQAVTEARTHHPQSGAGKNFHGRFIRQFTINGEDGDEDGPAGGQAEISIAVDASGQHIVVGFNDTRGFSLNPFGVSGFAYSDDGGATFIDGGQLPTTGNTNLNGTIN